MTARDHLAVYVEWMHVRDLTTGLIHRRASLLRAVEHFMGKSLLQATQADLAAWLLAERRRVSDPTVYCYVRHLGAFYTWAVEEGLVRRDPTRRLIARRPRYLPRPIAEDKLAEAIEAANPRARIVLALAAYGGLRAIEIARLDRADILEHNAPPVLVAHGKGRKRRIVPIPPRLLDELTRYGLPMRGPLIRRLDGSSGNVGPSLVSTLGNRALHDLGIPDTLHSLRHRYGTRVYALSKDLRLTQELLGHASPGADVDLHAMGAGVGGVCGGAALSNRNSRPPATGGNRRAAVVTDDAPGGP